MLILPIGVQSRFAYVFCKLLFSLTGATAFFLHVLSARAYRDELVLLSKKIFQYRRTIHDIIRIKMLSYR
jgi:hypothetical protein